jgi:hypothetical protein
MINTKKLGHEGKFEFATVVPSVETHQAIYDNLDISTFVRVIDTKDLGILLEGHITRISLDATQPEFANFWAKGAYHDRTAITREPGQYLLVFTDQNEFKTYGHDPEFGWVVGFKTNRGTIDLATYEAAFDSPEEAEAYLKND